LRVGFGYDVHAFQEDRPLMLGGVEIPHTHGLQGHSDADVLVHAICDALLGAAALGDLGIHFPDTDSSFKGISSLLLLKKSVELIRSQGFDISNIDSTIVAQRPKISPFILPMREKIARTAQVNVACINVKATTTERLGFAGREEGIAAYAVTLLVGS